MSLRAQLILRFFAGLIVFAALLFIPAGSLRFWPGWIYLAVFFITAFFGTLYLSRYDPQLLARRMQSKEKIREQRYVVGLLKLVLLAAFVLPGLDYRFGWSRAHLAAVPWWMMLLGQALVLTGLVLTFWVFKVNSFASRTIQVEAGQPVISGGPYGVVRHPMYSGQLLTWLATPLALGSYVAFPAFVLLIPFYVLRLLNEEEVLRKELPRYPEYCQHTQFRLVPLVW